MWDNTKRCGLTAIAYSHKETSGCRFAVTTRSLCYKERILTTAMDRSNICNYILSFSRINWRLCTSHHSSADGSHVGRKLYSRMMESTSSRMRLLPSRIPVPISAQKFYHSGWHKETRVHLRDVGSAFVMRWEIWVNST